VGKGHEVEDSLNGQPLIVRITLKLVEKGGSNRGQCTKLKIMNDVQHRTGQEMHREVRATLTSVSKLS
jgi:hypothetical protein